MFFDRTSSVQKVNNIKVKEATYSFRRVHKTLFWFFALNNLSVRYWHISKTYLSISWIELNFCETSNKMNTFDMKWSIWSSFQGKFLEFDLLFFVLFERTTFLSFTFLPLPPSKSVQFPCILQTLKVFSPTSSLFVHALLWNRSSSLSHKQ